MQVLSSCFTFSPFAKEILPPILGQNAVEFLIRLSSAPAEFVRKARIVGPIKPTVHVPPRSPKASSSTIPSGGSGGGGGSDSSSFAKTAPYSDTRFARRLATTSASEAESATDSVAEDTSMRRPPAPGGY
jgi:hypothetical protein